MAKELKNDKDLIDVQMLIKNLAGEEFETVDYVKKVTGILYKHCQEIGEE